MRWQVIPFGDDPSKSIEEEHPVYPEHGTEPIPCGDACGVLPSCAPLAVPYVPFQQTGAKRYDQMEALSSGTLYPGLDLPFRAKKPAAAVAESPLTQLQALEFVVQELALYLDTHPSDGEAFALFQKYTAMEQEARAAYAADNGPMMRSETAACKTYTWPKDPWPWNVEEGRG